MPLQVSLLEALCPVHKSQFICSHTRLDTLEVFAVGVAGNHLATIIVAEAHIATSSLESAAMIIYRECIMPILKLAGVLVPTYEAALKQHLMHGRIYLAYGLHAVPN